MPYKYKQNLHTHTTYADGRDTPEEMILKAIERGFQGVGFSEHTFMPFSSYPHQMKIEHMETYRQEVLSFLKKYRGQIDIFCGLEYEFYSDVPTDDFDYIIGSVHYLNVNGNIVGFDTDLPKTVAYIEQHFDGDGMKFAEKYFETVARLPQRGKTDIIGHFDLLVKNNEKGQFLDTDSPQYLQLGLDAIHALKGKIPLFEVNTGAVARGYSSVPYPQAAFLKEFKNCGFGAVITSDCHDKNFIDCHFDEAVALLQANGFTTHWILTDEGFKEVPLCK